MQNMWFDGGEDVMNIVDAIKHNAGQVEQLQKVTQELGEYFSRPFINFLDAFKPIADGIRSCPDNLKELLPYLLQRGWYLPLVTPIPLINTCKALMDDGKHVEIEKMLCDHARSRVDDSRVSIAERWPERTSIINDAFEAMSRGKYTLSIPVMLAQVDGMLSEVFDIQNYFSGKTIGGINKNNIYALILDNATLDILSYLFEESIKDKAIRASKKDREASRQDSTILSVFNRHEILHGESVDYASESNALRAVMLLDFSISIYDEVKYVKSGKIES